MARYLVSARPSGVVSCCSGSSSRSEVKQEAVEWGCPVYSPDSAKLLQSWLTSQRLPPQKLSLQPVSSGGRGLVAKTNIRQGEKLLYVPSSLIITTDSEWSNPQSGSLLLGEDVPDWPFLATFLISEASKGQNSPWHSYISALPQEPESILLWSETEVRKYLYASSIVNQARERIAEVESTFNSMNSSIYRKHPDLFSSKFFTLKSFKWAFGILFSRLVRLQSLNQQVALVPWADMLNHSSQVSACLDFEGTSKTIVLTTDRSYKPSEQVFISYGDKSRGEILLSYGFVSEENNMMDSIDLSFALKRDDPRLTAKQAALKEHGISSPCKYPLTIQGLPSQLFAFAYLAASPPSMEASFSEMAAAAASKEGGSLDGFRPPSMSRMPFDIDIDIQAYEIMLITVEASLAKTSKFLEENEAVTNNGMPNGKEGKPSNLNQPSKLAMACTLCASEQIILQRAQYVLRSKLRQLRARKMSGESPLGMLYGLGKLFK